LRANYSAFQSAKQTAVWASLFSAEWVAYLAAVFPTKPAADFSANLQAFLPTDGSAIRKAL
jgi:hypothetical protein